MERQGIALLPYACQRVMLTAYEASGRLVYVRRQRSGSLLISLDGRRGVCVHNAMARVEAWYGTLSIDDKARYAGQ